MGDPAYGRNKLLQELNYHRRIFSTKCNENFCLKQQEKNRRNILKEKKNIRPMSMQNGARIYNQAESEDRYIKKSTKTESGKSRINTEIFHMRKDTISLKEQNKKQQILIDTLQQKLIDHAKQNFSGNLHSVFSKIDREDDKSDIHSDYGSIESEMFQAEFDSHIPEKTEYWEETAFLGLSGNYPNETKLDLVDFLDSNSDFLENSIIWDMENDCQTDFNEKGPIISYKIQKYQPLSIDSIEKLYNLGQNDTKMDIFDEKGKIPMKIDHEFTKMDIFDGKRELPIKNEKNDTKMDIFHEKEKIPIKIDFDFKKMVNFDGKGDFPIKIEKNDIKSDKNTSKKAVLTEMGQKPIKME